MNLKYLILGAGPSGLAVANALLDSGLPHDQILILEKEGAPGGLCRSREIDGAPLDIGGGHFLDLRRSEVLEFLFRFLPRDEWRLFERISKIRLYGGEVDHPLEANLWQLPLETQLDYLESIACAGCVRGDPMPDSFAAWITWKLGERIAQDYMLPYNRKIWGMNPDELGTYWLHKLPDVSFRETLLSCLQGRPSGTLPAHGTFLYPKRFGYGEVWERMGQRLGESLILNCPVQKIDLASRTVNGNWRAETIISTIPWTLWPHFCSVPSQVAESMQTLKSAATDIDYYSTTVNSSAHWIYEPDESISYHRLLLRSNFVAGARGHWTETNSCRANGEPGIRFRNEFAYPLNTRGKREAIRVIQCWATSQNILGLGRWGQWEHMNSDVAVAEGLAMARRLTEGAPG